MSALHGAGDAERQRAEGLDRASLDKITRELREDGWMPRESYPCGCNHAWICPVHAERRAIDHYHPETIR